jgi:hypothetical protein
MEGERLDHDAFRALKGMKHVTEHEWHNLLERLEIIEQCLEEVKRVSRQPSFRRSKEEDAGKSIADREG